MDEVLPFHRFFSYPGDLLIMKHIFTVSQVNSYIHRIFDSDYALRRICIQGEISNCKYHSSGHLYFSMKDDRSSIRCVMFSGDRRSGLDFRLENGQLVLVTGHVSVFERDGSYQLYAKNISLAGAGLLYQKFELLKNELAEKGYFDHDRKKELPPYPKTIGIVTAATGAAIEDIKSIAARRNPYVQLYLYPARVQGEGAAESVASGIRFFDDFGVDVIIIGRGGGSMEDLWAFNERVLADAIYQARTPVISGTGHEVDMTIADYCADLRAPTPSAACEMAIPDVFALLQQIDRYQDALEGSWAQQMDRINRRIDLYHRLLEANHPGTRLKEQRNKLKTYIQQMDVLIRSHLRTAGMRADHYGEKLTALSPSVRLSGGFVYAHKKDMSPVSSIRQIREGEDFSLIFRDGRADVHTLKISDKEGI